MDTIWISNAGKTAKARAELRVELEEPRHEMANVK